MWPWRHADLVTQGGRALLAALAQPISGQFGAWLIVCIALVAGRKRQPAHLFHRAGHAAAGADIAMLRGSSYLWQIVNYSLAIGSIGLFLRAP